MEKLLNGTKLTATKNVIALRRSDTVSKAPKRTAQAVSNLTPTLRSVLNLSVLPTSTLESTLADLKREGC